MSKAQVGGLRACGTRRCSWGVVVRKPLCPLGLGPVPLWMDHARPAPPSVQSRAGCRTPNRPACECFKYSRTYCVFLMCQLLSRHGGEKKGRILPNEAAILRRKTENK